LDKLLSTKEVAEMLNITSRTVRNLIDTGELPAYKIGRNWRIKKNDLMKFIEEGSNQE